MTIALAKNYTSLLDEVYQNASLTADLTADPELVRSGANAKEILIPTIEVSGLGDYDRNAGYVSGSVSVGWETKAFEYDRGLKLMVDEMDNQETFDIAAGKAGAELERTQVAPENDAYTFAKIAGITGISKATPATLADGAAFLAALDAAMTEMDDDEVPAEDRILYATPTLINSVRNLDTNKSREVLDSFAVIKKVPQSRFYTSIDMLDGKTSGEEAGGYVITPVTGKNINFLIVHKPAVIKYDKHVVSAVIPPAQNPDADAYIIKYRKYGIVEVFTNKVAGIYLHHKA